MKSFSALTKEELYKIENQKKCCSVAELAGMILFGGNLSYNQIKFVTESEIVLEKYTKLCESLGIKATIRQHGDGVSRYIVVITHKTDIVRILKDFGLIDETKEDMEFKIPSAVKNNDCCKRAFVKGAFMGGGTVIDPNKNYNLEIITAYLGLSNEFLKILNDIGFNFKTAHRKSKYVLYTKSSEGIADFLTYIGAFKAQMELINIKIEKEIRNDFNRSANSEAANLDKTIEASVRQIQAIELIDSRIGMDELSDDLKELARLRLDNRSASMTELGQMLSKPLGKSGVNRRFQKLLNIADKLEA